MLQDDRNRLRHMLYAALEAQEFMKGVTLETLPDEKTTQAVVRSIEIIGEEAANISKEFQQKYQEIPWKKIVGMRNKLIHAYFDVDNEHVWNTVHKDLPILIPQLRKILNEE